MEHRRSVRHEVHSLAILPVFLSPTTLPPARPGPLALLVAFACSQPASHMPLYLRAFLFVALVVLSVLLGGVALLHCQRTPDALPADVCFMGRRRSTEMCQGGTLQQCTT